MSAPKFEVWHVDLDDMSVKYIGRHSSEDALKHPDAWTFVVLEGCTYMRTPKEPIWRKLEDGKPKSITIKIAKSEDDHEPEK